MCDVHILLRWVELAIQLFMDRDQPSIFGVLKFENLYFLEY